MKTHGDVDTRIHITAATALGRDRVANSMLVHLYHGKARYINLQETDWDQESIWLRRREEKSLCSAARDQTRDVHPF